jgi:hypothetical protein
MSILKATRFKMPPGAPRVTLLLGMCASLIGVLVCWPGISSPAWAQGNSGAPSLGFRVERLEAELHKAGEPTTEVIVRNGNDQDNDLEFDAVLQNSGGLFRTGTTPSLKFLGDPLELELQEGKIPVEVTVRNGSSQELNLAFSAVLRDNDGDPRYLKSIEPQANIVIGPYEVEPVDLDIEAADPSTSLAGHLVVSGADGARIVPGTIPLNLNAPETRPPWFSDLFNWLLIGALLCSAVVMLGSYLIKQPRRTVGEAGSSDFVEMRLSHKQHLGTTLKLDFDESWTSLLTLVAAVLTAITGAEVFPEVRPYLSAEEIAGLSLCFGGMLLFAPAFYNLIRTRATVSPKLKGTVQEDEE